MADNITLNSGTGGSVIATEDEGGFHYQKIKLTASGTGTTEDLTKAEDAAHTSGHHGVMALAVRAATVADLSAGATDGDYEPLQVSATGRLWTSTTVDSALPAGTNAIGKLAANSGVDIGDVDVTSIVPLTGATNLGKAVDGVAGASDVGVAPLAVRDDALTTLTPVDGDYVHLRTTSTGALWVANAGASSILTDDAAFTPGTSSVAVVGGQADESSTDSVDEGDAGALRMTLDRKLIVNSQPHTAGGLSIFRSLDLDETEEDVKTAAGQVYGMWVTNTATSTRFLKFYNATAANVTVGSTTPVITFGIPGNTSDDVSGLFSSTNGITFDTAICVAATTGVADADTGAPAANDVIVNIFYK